MEVTPFNANPASVHHSSLRLYECSLHCPVSLICANPLTVSPAGLTHTWYITLKLGFVFKRFLVFVFKNFFFLAFVSVAISSSWLLAIKKVYVFKSHYDSKTAVGYMYVKHTASSRSGLQTADCFLPALYTFVSLASVSPLGNQDESSHNSRGRFNTPPSHHY